MTLPFYILLAAIVALAIRQEQIRKANIMDNIALAAALDALTKQQGKIAKEQSDRFDAQSKKIQELTDAINAGGTVSPEVVTKLAELQAATQLLDDAIPDAPVEPPTASA